MQLLVMNSTTHLSLVLDRMLLNLLNNFRWGQIMQSTKVSIQAFGLERSGNQIKGIRYRTLAFLLTYLNKRLAVLV
jgi:hypothetical protein